MPLDDYESLSREERLRRVCVLLNKAVTLACIREEAANSEAAPIPVGGNKSSPTATADIEDRENLQSADVTLLREIHRRGEIFPREATRLWGVSRATAHRRISRLERAGWIAKHGATTAARYRLTEQATALLRQVRQDMQPSGPPQGSQ